MYEVLYEISAQKSFQKETDFSFIGLQCVCYNLNKN